MNAIRDYPDIFFVFIHRDKCSPYHTSEKHLFATKTITKNHNQSKCRILETVLNGYVMIQLLFPGFRNHCRRKIVKTRNMDADSMSSLYDRKASPTKFQHCDCLKLTNTGTTIGGMPMWVREVSQGPTPR